MKNRKTKRAVYFVREARELFNRTAAFCALTVYTLIAHVSGKHHVVMSKGQGCTVLYNVMLETNRHNGTNRCAAIPERDGNRFIGIRRIPATSEGKAIVLAYRQKRMDEVNKLVAAQLEIIDADKSKGMLTTGQAEKLIGSTRNAIEQVA